jgi:hypothetical protein
MSSRNRHRHSSASTGDGAPSESGSSSDGVAEPWLSDGEAGPPSCAAVDSGSVGSCSQSSGAAAVNGSLDRRAVRRLSSFCSSLAVGVGETPRRFGTRGCCLAAASEGAHILPRRWHLMMISDAGEV